MALSTNTAREALEDQLCDFVVRIIRYFYLYCLLNYYCITLQTKLSIKIVILACLDLHDNVTLTS